MKFALFFTAVLLNTGVLSTEELDVSKPLRIHQLMPREGMFVSLPIDPALPDDFVALSEGKEIDYSDWVYWGPEKVVKAYLEDPSETKSPSEPILRVRFAYEAPQKKEGLLEIDLIKQDLTEAGVKNIKIDSGMWKELPYSIFSGSVSGKKLLIAYVGCNQDGHVLLFNLMFPEDSKKGLVL